THTLALTLEPWMPRAFVMDLRRRFGQGKDRVLAPALRRLDRQGMAGPRGTWRDFPSALSRQLAFDTLQRLLPSLLRYEDRKRLLTPGPLHEWVSLPALRVELEDFLAGRREIGLQIWRWLSLESWARGFAEGAGRGARAVPVSRAESVAERAPDAASALEAAV